MTTIRVLLVEDSPTDAKLVLHSLQSPGTTIESVRVEDASALRAALADHDWDVVVSDWSLPKFNAFAALEIVKACGKDLPFIVVSGTIGEETAVDAMHAGACDYVLKDNLARLRPAVDRELREWAERRARRQAEEATRATETRFRALIENSVDAITLTSLDGELLYASPAMGRMLGFATDELVYKNGATLIHPDDKAIVAKAAHQIRQPGAANTTIQFRAIHADGSIVWLEATATNLLHEPAVGAVVGNIRNITEQRRALDGLKASEMRFARLSESGIIGIVIANVHGDVLEANDAYLRIVGYDREELASGKVRWADMIPADSVQQSEMIANQLTKQGTTKPWEQDILRKDGTRIPVLLGVAMLEYPICISFVAELADLKRAEQALRESEMQLRQAQKMEAVGILAGGVAHDFNNMLSVILSCSDLILSDLTAGDPIRNDVDEIRKAGLRAADLTRQLLMFSRQQIVESKVLDLNEILTGMDKMLHRLVGEDVDVAFIPSPAAGSVRADRGSIEQVVMNLVVNARDAMPTGGKITVETSNVTLDDVYVASHHGAKAGAYVMMAVTDTGTGMDKATIARIFEPFFTTKGVGKGTGLGLSTVFGIVQQAGGHLWVYSELGKGTTFKVYLPRVDAPAEQVRPKGLTPSLRGTETILLVEDEESVRAVALGILRRHGYAVIEARNASEAMAACDSESSVIHLLLTDVVMPQMSGPELAKRLVAKRPAMKVLYMSGYTDDAALRHGLIESGIAYLQKPLTVESLTRKVREVIGPAKLGLPFP